MRRKNTTLNLSSMTSRVPRQNLFTIKMKLSSTVRPLLFPPLVLDLYLTSQKSSSKSPNLRLPSRSPSPRRSARFSFHPRGTRSKTPMKTRVSSRTSTKGRSRLLLVDRLGTAAKTRRPHTRHLTLAVTRRLFLHRLHASMTSTSKRMKMTSTSTSILTLTSTTRTRQSVRTS